jgi:hypothetical protein
MTGTLSTDSQFCQITGTGNSAKSLACSSTYRQFCQITGTLSTDRQFCKITGTGQSAKSLITDTLLHIQLIMPNHWHAPLHAQAILPNHWHTPPHTGIMRNHWHSVHRQTLLQNHWHRQFCQITGTLLHIQPTGDSAKSLAHSSTDRQFFQITGTGKSTKSLAHFSTYRK